MIGTLLNNRYRIDATLGEGGMGIVYRAHDSLLDRTVAIKTLSPALLGSEGIKRLQREAQAAAKLTHPNIVGVHDVLDDGDSRLIVMEYVQGKTLRDLLPLPWTETTKIVQQVCDALEYAHKAGVVHRDIKPENIVVTPDGTAKIMDFGLARSEGRSRLTQTGMIAGTVAYMAPEQAMGGQVDGRSDLYSVGAVLYEAVSGRPPFEADDPIAVISMHVNVPPISPRLHAPDMPAVLESTILRLLAKDPTERYGSAREVREALQLALASSTEVAGQAVVSAVRPSTSLFDLMTRGRLIDREEELAALKGALETTLSGQGQVVLIAGEPGIGKTRLADELLVYARLRGGLAVAGHCYEQEVNVAYLPIAEALRSAIREIPQAKLGQIVGSQAPEIIKLVPEMAHQIPGLTPSPPLEPDRERLRLYEAVSSFLAGLSQTRPVVVMLDDLNWADAATLSLLRHLARSTRTNRLLLLGTYRDVEVESDHPLSAALSEMNRERLYKRVLIRGLTNAHVAEMIHTIFQTQNPVSEEFRDLIYRETEGNPFFVEEALKHLVETGDLYLQDGRWERKPIQDIDVPQSIREVIGRRLKRISEPSQQALSLAAVIGRRFRFEVLQAVGEVGEDRLLDALEEALRAQLIREHGNGGKVDYDFAHATIREVLYERLSLRRRMTLHQKVGETLERIYNPRLEAVAEDLAHHFTRAPHGTGLEKAIQYSISAAQKSMTLFAHEEAVRYYKNALELLEEINDERRAAEVSTAMGEPFQYLDRTDEAFQAYTRALHYHQQRDGIQDVARLEYKIGHALQRHWEFPAAVPHLERALHGLDPQQDNVDVIQTHLDLARAHIFMRNVEQSSDHAQKALALAEASRLESLQAAAQVAIGLAADQTSQDAYVHYSKAMELAQGAGDVEAYYTLGRALNNMAVIHDNRGEFDQSFKLLRQALAIGERAKDVEQISWFNLHWGTMALISGDWRTARERHRANMALPLSPARRHHFEPRLRFMEGNWEGAAEQSLQHLENQRRRRVAQEIFASSSILIWFLLELGHHEVDFRDTAIEAAEVAQGNSEYVLWPVFPFLAEGLARCEEFGLCEDLCDKAEQLAQSTENRQGLAHAYYGRAVVAAVRGELDTAINLFEKCTPLVHQGGVTHARMLELSGELLLRRNKHGDRERAQDVFAECLGLHEKMENRRKIDQLRARLSALSPASQV